MTQPIANLIEEIGDRMEEIVRGLDLVNADKVGLDRRAGFVLVSREGIVVPERHVRTLEYYGGFEYVDRDYVQKLGDYTFYSRDDDRVKEAIEYYMDGGEKEEEEEEEEE